MSDQNDVNASALPCAESCPKCGSTDCRRQYRRQGEKWRTYGVITKQPVRDTPYLREDWIEGECKVECISHYCRCCGFRWESDVVKSASDPRDPVTP
jgi:hypothetical protein